MYFGYETCPEWILWAATVGHWTEKSNKSLLLRSVIFALPSWSDAIWHRYLSSSVNLITPSQSPRSPLSPGHTDVHIRTHTFPSLPSCHWYFRARSLHEPKLCQWAWHSLCRFLIPPPHLSQLCNALRGGVNTAATEPKRIRKLPLFAESSCCSSTFAVGKKQVGCVHPGSIQGLEMI